MRGDNVKRQIFIKSKEKFVNVLFEVLAKGIIIIPLISLLISYNFAKLYFDNSIQRYELFLIVPLIIMQMIFVLYYLVELYDIVQLKSRIGHKIKLFVIIVVHIVQLFANIYLIIIAIDHSILSTIVAETPLELLFDITYFSVMIFVGGDGILNTQSRLVQGVIMFESMMLPIYISIILFGLCGVKHTIEENSEDK